MQIKHPGGSWAFASILVAFGFGLTAVTDSPILFWTGIMFALAGLLVAFWLLWRMYFADQYGEGLKQKLWPGYKRRQETAISDREQRDADYISELRTNWWPFREKVLELLDLCAQLDICRDRDSEKWHRVCAAARECRALIPAIPDDMHHIAGVHLTMFDGDGRRIASPDLATRLNNIRVWLQNVDDGIERESDRLGSH